MPRPSPGHVLTRRGWTLLGAGLGLFVAGRLLGAVELSVLATAAALLLVTAALWARLRTLDLVARRAVRPARLHVGSEGRVDLVLVNRGLTRTPQLTVTDLFDDGRRVARFLLPPLAPDGSARAAYRLPTGRRGRHRIGPLAIAATDPFGLARQAWVIGEVEEATVCPRVHDILPSSQPAGRLTASVESLRAQALASESGEEFLTLREYEVGDDLRRVHWRSTARVGDLMIRQNEAQWRPRVVIVLDVRPDAHDDASFEIAVEATASVLDRLHRMHRRVEVVTSAGQRLGGGRRGRTSSIDVMEQLATIEVGGVDRLAAVLASLRSRRRTGLVVAIAGTLTPHHLDQLAALTAYATVAVVSTRPNPQARAGLVAVDASSTPFVAAWNEAMTRWKLTAPATSLRSPSPR